MPQRKSAQKELRKNRRRHERNVAIKKKIKYEIKQLKKTIQNKDVENSNKLLSRVYSILDKAAKKNVIHPNKAARRKSRLSTLLSHSLNK